MLPPSLLLKSPFPYGVLVPDPMEAALVLRHAAQILAPRHEARAQRDADGDEAERRAKVLARHV